MPWNWSKISIHIHFPQYDSAPYLYYNYEKSPLKRRFLVLIEQYLPNISDSVYSVQQWFMWFLWLNWRKSTFYPITAPNDSKYWPFVTSSIQEPAASNCDNRLFPRGCYGRFLSTMMLRTVNTSCFNFFSLSFFFLLLLFCDPRVSTRGIASWINWHLSLQAIPLWCCSG